MVRSRPKRLGTWQTWKEFDKDKKGNKDVAKHLGAYGVRELFYLNVTNS